MNRKILDQHNWINAIQSVLLVATMTLLLAITGWLLGGYALAIVAVGFAGFLYMFYPLMTPYLIARTGRLRPLQYEEAPRLYRFLEILAERAGLQRLPTLLYLPGDAMGAFTMGTQNNAVVALSEGLLRRLETKEIVAVLAHEISHTRYGDTHIMRFADMTGRLTNILSTFGQFLLLFNLPMILIGGYTVSWLAIILLITAPMINLLLQLSLSRSREYRADYGAAELMEDPMPLASALMKIERHQTGILQRNIWPMRMPTPEHSLLRTHPPTKERIKRLYALSSQQMDRRNMNLGHPFPARNRQKQISPRYVRIPQLWRPYRLDY